MKTKLKREESGGNYDYFIVDENENQIAKLSDKLGEEISEAVDHGEGFYSATYTDRTSKQDLFAIFDATGRAIRQSIRSIVQFIPERKEFILIMKDNELWCVINHNGTFVHQPEFASISYIEEKGEYVFEKP